MSQSDVHTAEQKLGESTAQPSALAAADSEWVRRIDIVDSHVHFTDRTRLAMAWLEASDRLGNHGKDYTRADHFQQCRGKR